MNNRSTSDDLHYYCDCLFWILFHGIMHIALFANVMQYEGLSGFYVYYISKLSYFGNEVILNASMQRFFLLFFRVYDLCERERQLVIEMPTSCYFYAFHTTKKSFFGGDNSVIST